MCVGLCLCARFLSVCLFVSVFVLFLRLFVLCDCLFGCPLVCVVPCLFCLSAWEVVFLLACPFLSSCVGPLARVFVGLFVY